MTERDYVTGQHGFVQSALAAPEHLSATASTLLCGLKRAGIGFLYLPFVFMMPVFMPCLDNSKVNLLKVKHYVFCFVNYYIACARVRYTDKDKDAIATVGQLAISFDLILQSGQ
ncbi:MULTISPECIES: hypothetical protein [unclassified Anaerobiospirillum]|uniref:hypothetical protein n=1 Tax=unclassified Anaerobiospirillum TaxID=2647410 RepID=UPI001FF1DDD4|nr:MULTISPECIES: hypothetical protein [unclassified Anaerobiospirillum]MCK0533968.1 hypothetical protein [Anaerobiospirillum sp. NML120511]MCK0539170.1 hypothetical protein [Anaerobiospirillum sp. NML02-A-032]